jgi:glyoxylase-like metal-dependent hydrolase (beta-lactamase superfamily II)
MTDIGPVCLASDASHYYENFEARKPFPIIADLDDMLKGFDRIVEIAEDPARVIPGHDPLVTERFAPEGTSGFVWRLDRPLARQP